MKQASKGVKFTAVLEFAGNGLGWHFVPVTREIGEQFPSDGKSRRVVCTLNGKEEFQCALMPSGERFCIMVNKRVRASLRVAAGNMLHVSLKADTSKYGLRMPKELEEVFRQDPEGDELFHALTPGKQRSLIYQVNLAKDVDRRIRRALVIVQHLKDNAGRIVGDKLYHELKRPAF